MTSFKLATKGRAHVEHSNLKKNARRKKIRRYIIFFFDACFSFCSFSVFFFQHAQIPLVLFWSLFLSEVKELLLFCFESSRFHLNKKNLLLLFLLVALRHCLTSHILPKRRQRKKMQTPHRRTTEKKESNVRKQKHKKTKQDKTITKTFRASIINKSTNKHVY